MTRILALTLTVFLASCADDDPSNPDPGADGGGQSVEPASGTWHYTEVTPISNDCDFSDRYGDNGDFSLSNNGDRTFTVAPHGGSDPFECLFVSGDRFSCPDRGSATEDFTSAGFDAVVAVQARASGTFSDSRNASGRQDADVSCTGSDCGLAEQVLGVELPCTFSVNYRIRLR